MIEIDCSYNELKKLDVSKQSILEYFLNCSHNRLEKLKLGVCSLYWLDCSYNKLSKLDISGLHELAVVDCRCNSLDLLDIRKADSGVSVRKGKQMKVIE